MPGTKTRLADLTDEQLEVFAKQLCRIHALPIDALEAFCKKEHLTPLRVETLQSILEKYGFTRFSSVKQAIIGAETYRWISNQLAATASRIAECESTVQLHIVWSDIQSEIITGPDKHLYFYDFEHTHISNSTELGYIGIHGCFTTQQFKKLVDYYALHTNQTSADLEHIIRCEQKITRINDIVWAAMKWSDTGEEKFIILTQERMKLIDQRT